MQINKGIGFDPAWKTGPHPFENRAPNYQARSRTRRVQGRGYQLPWRFTIFYVPYPSSLLVVKPFSGSTSRAAPERGEMAGAPPPYFGSGAVPGPRAIYQRGGRSSTPRGEAAPATVIPAGRLGFRRHDPA